MQNNHTDPAGKNLPAKTKAGRPTKFHKSDLELVQKIRSEGFSVAKFCAARGIAKSTYFDWKKAYPEFDYATQVADVMAEAFWQDKYVTAALTNDKEFQLKVYDSLYDKLFPNASKTTDQSTQININQMNVVQSLSNAELENKARHMMELLGLVKDQDDRIKHIESE